MIDHISASPGNIIPAGESAHLVWLVMGCEHGCSISLVGRTNMVVLSVSNLKSSGSFNVIPHFSTTYTLTASNVVLGTDSKEISIHLSCPPGTTNEVFACSPSPQGSIFYFKMTSQSDVTPCFTIAIFDSNATAAKMQVVLVHL